MGQNQWYHLGTGAPPILVYFSGDWDVLTNSSDRSCLVDGSMHAAMDTNRPQELLELARSRGASAPAVATLHGILLAAPLPTCVKLKLPIVQHIAQ